MIKPVRKRWPSLRLRRFWRARRGAVAIEFSIITPLMAMLLLASVEGSALIWVRSSVSEAATAAADLTTQFVAIDETTIEDVFQAAERMISPAGGPVDGLELTITSVLTCPCDGDADRFCYSVIWSHGYRDGGLIAGFAEDAEFTGIPQELGISANSTMIVADAEYAYSPPITFFFFDEQALQFNGRAEFRPRQSREVIHVGGFQRNQAPTCS